VISLKKEFDKNETYFEYTSIDNRIPTIFIHGVGLDNTMWYPQKKKLSSNSIIFYDILNHGKSKKKIKELNFSMFNNQLKNLMNHLKIDRVNLVGFSIGALIAQHFVSSNYQNVNKLVLIGSVFKRSKEQISIVNNRFKEATDGPSITINSIKRWFTDFYLRKNPEVYNFFYLLLERKKNKEFLPAYKLFVESDQYKLDFSKFTMPTLIMTGENEVGSTVKMNKNLRKEIKKSILYIIKDAKHGATIEKAEDVNHQLKDFLFNKNN